MKNTDHKLGRNALCHCGSGKKFKQCCLGKAAATVEARSHLGWSIAILAIGVVGTGLVWNAKGIGPGLAILAGAGIVATAVYIFRDPAPPRKDGGDPSAINFGGKR